MSKVIAENRTVSIGLDVDGKTSFIVAIDFLTEMFHPADSF